MTLIVTAATLNFVAQVSDRRLTQPSSGELFSDDANKAVLLQCKDGTLSFAYSGLGFVGQRRTDDWITDVLGDLGAADMRGGEVIDSLTEAATDQFTKLSPRPVDARLTVAVCGWPAARGLRRSFVGFISNFEELEPFVGTGFQRSHCYGKARATFSSQVSFPNPRIKNASFIQTTGRDEAVAHFNKRQRKLRDFILRNPGPEAVTRKLVAFIRRCADHPEEGKYIGRDCMAVFISDDGCTSAYYPEDSSRPVSFAPHLVAPGFAVKDIYISNRHLTREEMERWKHQGKRGAPDV